MERGLRVEYSEFGACQGIYLSVRPWIALSDPNRTNLRVVVRIRNPCRVRAVEFLPDAVGLPAGTEKPAEVRERLLAAGYDGVLTEWGFRGMENQFVVVLRDEDARIIVP